MDRSIQYTQSMPNFDSVYNTAPNRVYQPTIYIPISSSNQSISASLRSSNPKFNFDLYNPTESHSESIDYPSPSSSVIIHHHPVHSPPPSQSILKLRQINDELCHTLAQCDITTQSQPSPPLHYQIHHYPIPHETYHSRSRSPSEQDSSSTDSEPIPKKKHNARITYKAHIPRRPNSLSKIDQLLISTSDVYSQDDPMTIDLYPTRDQNFVKKIRNRPDNQSPWLADTSPIRRNSYSETSTYRTPRGPDYDDKLIQPKSRLFDGKERRRPSSVKSRIRPDTVPNPLRQSAISFSNTAPVWRPNGTIQRPKFIGSNAPPSKPKPPPPEAIWNPAGVANKKKQFRAFDPVSKPLPTKPQEPVWNPPSKKLSEKPTRYFERTLKPELTAPIPIARASMSEKKPIKNQRKIQGADPKLKTRIAQAESKVKSAWDPTSTDNQSKPPIVPRPIQKATTTIPTKPKVKSVPSQPIVPVKKIVPTPPIATDTGRSSLNDVPTKPLFESTPRNQSIDEDPDDLFENESVIAESPKKTEIPHPPPQIEKTPTKLPNITMPEPDKGTKATIKDGVLIHGDDENNRTMSEVNNNDDDEQEPSLIHPEPKASSPKPNNRDDVSIIDDEDINQTHGNDTDADIEHNLETNRSLDATAKADNTTPPHKEKSPPPPPPRKEKSSPPESPDQNSIHSPTPPKKIDQNLPSTPPPASATANNIDDFFD